MVMRGKLFMTKMVAENVTLNSKKEPSHGTSNNMLHL